MFAVGAGCRRYDVFSGGWFEELWCFQWGWLQEMWSLPWGGLVELGGCSEGWV